MITFWQWLNLLPRDIIIIIIFKMTYDRGDQLIWARGPKNELSLRGSRAKNWIIIEGLAGQKMNYHWGAPKNELSLRGSIGGNVKILELKGQMRPVGHELATTDLWYNYKNWFDYNIKLVPPTSIKIKHMLSFQMCNNYNKFYIITN